MNQLLLDLITLLLAILVLGKTSKSFDFSLNTIINLAKLLGDKPIIRLTLMEEWRLRDIPVYSSAIHIMICKIRSSIIDFHLNFKTLSSCKI